MASYEIRPLQLRILNILVVFDKICREHNLRYYLWAGTMLGAVRHGGFIPWDDDADVAMPREDYEILISHSEEWFPKPMEITCLEKNPKFTGTYARMIDASTTIIERYDFKSLGGIYIDIFPIDGVSAHKIKAMYYCMRYALYKNMAYFCNRNPYKHGKGISSWIPRIVQHFYTNEKLQRQGIKMMKQYSYNSATLVCDFDDGTSGIFPKKYLGKPTPIEFEGRILMGIANPDKYLTHKYGNYMTIPQKSHQRQHNFYYLNYNLPYREYKDTREFMSINNNKK